jgi:hypothetical protein
MASITAVDHLVRVQPTLPTSPTYAWQQQSTGTGDVADPNISQQQITRLVSDKS